MLQDIMIFYSCARKSKKSWHGTVLGMKLCCDKVLVLICFRLISKRLWHFLLVIYCVIIFFVLDI